MSDSEKDKPLGSLDGTSKPKMDFPPLPHTVAEVSQLLGEMEGEPDTLRLAEIVDSDPVVAAAVLRRINSAYYGMRRRIGNVRKAVMLLGFLEVANIVLTSGMIKLEEVFSTGEQAEIFEQIMQLSVGTGQTGREMSDILNLGIEGQVYTAGLLHAVGRLVFLYNHPSEYAVMWRRGDQFYPPAAELEEQMFGVKNTAVGAQAADAWKLPTFLVTALRNYPSPHEIEDEEQALIATVVGVSASAVYQYGCAPAEEEVEFDPPAQLQYLASLVEVEPQLLIDQVVDKQEQIRSYVDAMTYR